MAVIREGKVSIEMGEGVFYNPRMEMNRDLNVACLTCLPDVTTYVDAMAASGIRGIRVKKEVPREIDVTVNDWDAGAYELLKRNAEANGVTVNATNRGANTLLSSTQYDFVDIDPFGTPSPYIDAVCRSAKRFMGVTATDTAPLCGAHLRSGMRKYGAFPVKTEYYPEIGLRVLMGKVVREQAKYDRAVRPLLCHSTEHYVRLYLAVDHGVVPADRMLDQIGFILDCAKCHYRETIPGLAVQAPDRCPNCGGKARLAGPLWLGPLKDNGFVSQVLHVINTGEFGRKERAARLLELILGEIDVPTFYDHHRVCQDLKATPTTIEVLLETLRGAGYQASRTHFSGIGFRTDAPVNIVKSIVLALSPRS
ncbi:tRNA (guanine(10)-N(2))-dimethyltransferase [Methanocella sp. MCL-LM]|uniref:tRNA (guanine(10)-N(2))-dimethyltransferase n=1 Tax=Methanocella sp. MCL-LM TaxID=3412035 RepID=UPI003C723103